MNYRKGSCIILIRYTPIRFFVFLRIQILFTLRVEMFLILGFNFGVMHICISAVRNFVASFKLQHELLNVEV